MAQSRSLSCALHRARAARGADSTHEKALFAPMTLNESWFAPLVGTLILLAAAGAITAVVHFLLFRVVARLARLSATRVDDALFEFGAFKWLNRIVPFVVIKFGAGAVPGIPGRPRRSPTRCCSR